MYLDNKTVFVAGATGSVGSAILEHLINNYPKTRVRAPYRKTKPFIKHERIEYVLADLLLKEDVQKAVKGCDCAIMAASDSAGSKLMASQPWEYVNPNIIMNSLLLEAFYAAHIMRVVYIGTATVYQPFEGYIKEDKLDLNQDPHPTYYGVAWISRFIEKLCTFWYMKTGMETIIIRAANIFGPYARFDADRSYFIPAIIRKAADKMDPFEVWGSPKVTRDVIYSEDFARAIVLALNSPKIAHDIFNLGSGIKTTVGEVVDYALKYTNHKPSKVHYDLSKGTAIGFRALDIAKVKKALGWNTEFSIEEGIKKTAEWWLNNRKQWAK